MAILYPPRLFDIRFLPAAGSKMVLAVLALCLTLPIARESTAQTREPAFTIIHTADMSRLQLDAGIDRPDMRARGGPARVSAVIDDNIRRGRNVLVTSGGGVLSPSAFSLLDDGAHMIDVLNRVGVNAMSAGTHDFDFGPIVATARFGQAQFPVLIANASNEDGRWLENTQPSTLIAVGDFTVGLVGAVTMDVREVSRPGDLEFTDPVASIVSESESLRSQGAQIVIALAHLNSEEDDRLMETGAVNIVLGGHDEHTRVTTRNGVPLVETERDGQAVAVIDVYVDILDREVLPDPAELEALLQSSEGGRDGQNALDRLFEGAEVTTEYIPSFDISIVDTINVEPEIFTDIIVRQYETRFFNALGVPLGETSVPLDSREAEIRSRETTFGNLVADVVRATGAAEVAFVNAGSIRGDRTYEAGSVFTLNSVLEELPFDNRVVVLRLSGDELRAALAHSLENEGGPSPLFLQVSGMRVACQRDAAGKRAIAGIWVGGIPMNPTRTYTVATTDFLADGGDGYDMLIRAPRVRAGSRALPRMSLALADHFRETGTVTAAIDGRIACD